MSRINATDAESSGQEKFLPAAALMTAFLLFVSCHKDAPIAPSSRLLFASGFEGGVYIDKKAEEGWEDYRFIRGTDSITGFTWPITVLGASHSGLHYIDDDGHRAVFAELRRVTGYDGKPTTALYQQENYDLGVTQCPYEILNIREGKRDLCIRFRIRLDSTSLHQPDMWRTYFEWKSRGYAEGAGFRLIAFIYADGDGVPYWHFQGDRDPQHPLWEIDNREIPVPEERWFLNEFFWHWSPGDDGIALWKVDGITVAEHHGPTTRNEQPVDFIMLGQIYGDANPKHQWIDDIEIRDTLPE